MSSRKLLYRECLVVAVFGCALLLLVAESIYAKEAAREKVSECLGRRTGLVSVEILGAVRHPGVYEVVKGTSLKKILHMAKLQKGAVCDSAVSKRMIFRDCKIQVSKKENVCIFQGLEKTVD